MTQKIRKPIAFLAVFAMVMAAMFVIPSFWGTASAEGKWEDAAATDFDGGDGSSGSPYEIATAEQLAYLAQQVNGGESYQGQYFKLTANIDLGGKEWTPIGKYKHLSIDNPFKGVFDGNSKTISNLSIDSAETRVGLFGYNCGTIKNLALIGEVSGEDTVGGICGMNSTGTISNCSFSGNVSGMYGDIGGICGYNGKGTILNCINSAKVDGKFKCGGISGENYTDIKNCINVGKVSGTSSSVGGICGSNKSNISDCYFDKTVNNGLSACGGDDDNNTVKGLTTYELCGALPTDFDDTIWQKGSSDIANGTGTYISLINIGEPIEGEIPVYNFGTDDNPDMDVYTLITTPEEFKAIGEDDTKWGQNYVLGNNIDLGGAELTPIGTSEKPFTGKFGGAGHVVSNFTINKSSGFFVGLFGYNEGKIVNVGVENANVIARASSYAGGLCAANKGTIRNCYNASKVNGLNSIGGVCGANYNIIENCYNTGNVSGSASIGGVCGANSKTITNCYNTGTINGARNVGGVGGENTGTIENCYSSGKASGNSSVGGVCGKTNDNSITNCYYNKDFCTVGDSNATGLTTDELYKSENTSSFDYKNIWTEGSCIFTYDDNKPNFRTANYTLPSLKGVGKAQEINGIEQYNFGTDDDPDWDVYTLITTDAQFKKIGEDSTRWNENYVLGNNIDLGGAELTPIGSDASTPFKGKFSGAGHVVSNFTINKSSGVFVGLFGYNEGKIVNVGVENAKVTASGNYVGGVCGANSATGTIANCYNKGTVSGADSNTDYVGGVCGINNGGTITNCYNTGEVTNSIMHVGGVCGLNIGTIENCYNTGKVNGQTNVGGVCGTNGNTVTNCYSKGAVSGDEKVGGVCGYNTGTIGNCYSAGAVSGNSNVGGFCGASGGTITACYYSMDIFTGSGIGSGTEGTGSVTGLTTVELCTMTNIPGFDFDNIWEAGSSGGSSPDGTRGERFRIATYFLPSLKGVGEAQSVEFKQYDFSLNDTPEWDVYTLITTAEQFKEITKSSTRWNENYVLGNDISFVDDPELTPIGSSSVPFMGKFSGDGHVVSDFVISGKEYLGLFGYNNGRIEKLGVESSAVTATFSNVGGVCGVNCGTIVYCYNTGTVSGDKNIGGVCGDNKGTIQNCYNTGAVSGDGGVGGICGINSGTVVNCYSAGKVSGDGTGGICGINYNTDAFKNCYYNKDIFTGDGINFDVAGSGSAKGLTTGELCDRIMTAGFDFDNVWDEGGLDKETVDKNNKKFRTATYFLPSLNGVGKAQTITLKQYNFGYDGMDDWQIYTLITSAEQFKKIGEDNTCWEENYVLDKDLDFGGATLTPIGKSIYRGKFSGDGHVISSFVIYDTTSGNVGLFGRNLGLIEDLGIKNAQVTGNSIVGGVCGSNGSDPLSTGTIRNCYYTGSDDKCFVSGNDRTGGVCGENYGSIVNCYNTSKVSGGELTGGVCGINQDYIRNCYNTGDVSATGQYTGGVCGANGSIIISCYSTGAVSGTKYVGAVCGFKDGTVTDCYYSKDICTVGDSAATGRTTEELCCDTTKTSGFEYRYVWAAGSFKATVDKNNEKFRTATYVLPSLNGVGEAQTINHKEYNFGFDGNDDWAAYTLITTAEQFKKIGEDSTCWNKNYVLDKDIDLGGAEITPIGNNSTSFTGKFSGDGHVVSNFKINKSADNYVALFGKSQGTIIDVGVTEAEVTGKSQVAGVCGYNLGNIINCFNTATVSGEVNVGGVCGINGAIIKNCYNTGKVSGTTSVGGVCGDNNSQGAITNCYNTALISGDTSSALYVGGICGDNSGNVINCFDTGEVIGNDHFNEVCGMNSGNITNCYYNRNIAHRYDKNATGLTSLQMTDGNALETMGFGKDWVKPDNDKTNGIAYYPGLAVYAEDAPSIKYETKLVIELSDKDAEYKYGDKMSFDVSALVKFEGKTDFGANDPAATDCKGSFTVTVDKTTVVDSTEIFDNTTAKAVVPSINVAGDKTFKLVYDGTNSAYIASGTATCEVSIAKLDLKAEDFIFTAPEDPAYDGTAKKASVTAKDGMTGVGKITVKYYMDGAKTQPVEVGVYTVKIDVAEGDFYNAAADLTADGWTFTITKGIQSIDVPEEYVLTYGDSGKKIAAATDGDGAISYAVKTGADVINVASDGTITALKSGTATVEITAAETDHYTKAVKTVNITVNKAAVTITAKSYTINKGDSLPTFEYTVTGLVNGDTLAFTPTITCEADANTAGTFDIIVTAEITEDECYTYTTQNGTLTVKSKSSGGSGGGGRPTKPSSPSGTIYPAINGVSKNWNDIAADISKSAAGSVIIIQLNGNNVVPVDVIKAIADRDSKVTFVFDSVFSWVVDGAEITVPAVADLTVIRTANTDHTGLRGTEGTQLKINGTGIPTDLQITFTAAYAGKFANLYMSADGKLTFVTCAKLGADGKVLLPDVTAAGNYVAMLCEFSDRPGDMNNDGVLNAMDASAVLRDIVGLETGANPLMADFNGDGNVNALDASAILKKVVGLI